MRSAAAAVFASLRPAMDHVGAHASQLPRRRETDAVAATCYQTVLAVHEAGLKRPASLTFTEYRQAPNRGDGGESNRCSRWRPVVIRQGRALENLERSLVAHTGLEPVISALRGRRPGPLDECATAPTIVPRWPFVTRRIVPAGLPVGFDARLALNAGICTCPLANESKSAS